MQTEKRREEYAQGSIGKGCGEQYKENFLKELSPMCQETHVGLEKETLCYVVEKLYKLAANEFLLANKLKNYSWNVVGSNFLQLHTLFCEQAEELCCIFDKTCKHIRELGARVPNVCDIIKIADLVEIKPADWCDQFEMINCVLKDQETMLQCLRKKEEKVENKYRDPVMADFIIDVEQVHRTQAFKLRSFVVAPQHHEGGGQQPQTEKTAGKSPIGREHIPERSAERTGIQGR
jgi:starvation-inducible DNA-binding protein